MQAEGDTMADKARTVHTPCEQGVLYYDNATLPDVQRDGVELLRKLRSLRDDLRAEVMSYLQSHAPAVGTRDIAEYRLGFYNDLGDREKFTDAEIAERLEKLLNASAILLSGLPHIRRQASAQIGLITSSSSRPQD